MNNALHEATVRSAIFWQRAAHEYASFAALALYLDHLDQATEMQQRAAEAAAIAMDRVARLTNTAFP